MENLNGIITALLTPFNDDYSINYSSLEKLIEFNISQGIHGFYLCGSTGEGMIMSPEERTEIFRFVAKTVKNRVTLIGHVGAIGTADAVKMAKEAEKAGLDAVSAVAPFYYGFSYDAIKGYYFDIADATELPLVIYNFPASGGFTLTPDKANELLENKKIAAIKHTSQDLFMLERFKHLNREITVYNGFDEMLVAGLAMGADGGIGSTYNFMPSIILEIYNKFKNGDLKGAQLAQEKANEIISKLIKYGVFVSEKEILTQMGIPMGPCRKPFLPISEEGKREMCELAQSLRK